VTLNSGWDDPDARRWAGRRADEAETDSSPPPDHKCDQLRCVFFHCGQHFAHWRPWRPVDRSRA
jgi:hypothetical protein